MIFPKQSDHGVPGKVSVLKLLENILVICKIEPVPKLKSAKFFFFHFYELLLYLKVVEGTGL